MIIWFICGSIGAVLVYLEMYLNNKYGKSEYNRFDATVGIVAAYLLGAVSLAAASICVFLSLLQFYPNFKPVKDWFNKRI